MKNLIYQYWDGAVRNSVHAGVNAMKAYASRIGADYIFEDNPKYIHDRRFGNYSPHYGAFKPVFESPYNGRVEKEVELFTWEKLDKVAEVKKAFEI